MSAPHQNQAIIAIEGHPGIRTGDKPHHYSWGYSKKIASHLLLTKKRLARLLTLEQGKPLAQARAEVIRRQLFEWFGEEARRLSSRIAPILKSIANFMCYVVLGVAGVITPWNFPRLSGGGRNSGGFKLQVAPQYGNLLSSPRW